MVRVAPRQGPQIDLENDPPKHPPGGGVPPGEGGVGAPLIIRQIGPDARNWLGPYGLAPKNAQIRPPPPPPPPGPPPGTPGIRTPENGTLSLPNSGPRIPYRLPTPVAATPRCRSRTAARDRRLD